MDTATYLLTLCDNLANDWPLASGLKTLISGNVVDERTLDAVLSIVQSAIKDTTSLTQKEQLGKAEAFLVKLRSIEQQDQRKDMEDLQSLEHLLSQI